MATHDIKLSKTLAWLLRHHAVSQGLDMSDSGYVPCTQVIALLSKRCCIPDMTQQRLEEHAANCPKQRIELSPCRKYVRASRGHSIRAVKDDKLLTLVPETDGDAVASTDPVYGVSFAAWDRVKITGLRSGFRNHLHISTNGCKSGFVIGKEADTTANVVVHIDVKAALADGIAFYTTGTGMLLTRGLYSSGCLPAKYFTRAVLHNSDGTATELLPN